MRFGVKLMPQHCTWNELLALFRAADDNPLLLVRTAVRPLARPPFPLELLREL